jgi:clan AA aspartic protease
MTGRVDDDGRALVTISIRSAVGAPDMTVEAWIDTGFTGELVLPQPIIDGLGLGQSGTLNAQLGDGTFVVLETFTCLVDWLGQRLAIEVVANAGNFPLLGVGLLRTSKLTVDYPLRTVAIE